MTCYYIGNEKLSDICRKYNLRKQWVYTTMYEKDLMPDEALKHCLDTREERKYLHRKKGQSNKKYTLHNMYLTELLDRRKYFNLLARIRRYMKKNSCKFEESIIGKVMTEEDFNKLYFNMLNLKIANNIKLTQQETKDYIELANK